MTTHSTEDHRLVGRALTCVCVPLRQDLHEVATAESREFGFKGGYNKSAVDRLVEDDVMVVDLFDKVVYGTFFGGNLSTQLKNKTKRGGAVVWGGIRDLDQVKKIEASRSTTAAPSHPHPRLRHDRLHAPCRIGEAISHARRRGLRQQRGRGLRSRAPGGKDRRQRGEVAPEGRLRL